MNIIRRGLIVLAVVVAMDASCRATPLKNLEDDVNKLRANLIRLEAEKSKLQKHPPAGMAEEERQTRLKETSQLCDNLRAKLHEDETRLKKMKAEIKSGVDKTTGISNVCPVHKKVMIVKTVPIFYGMPMIPPGEPTPADRQKKFPFAGAHCEGGCILRDETRARVYVCAACVAAEKTWKQTHKHDD